MLELTGLTLGVVTFRKTRSRSRLLRAALLAQVADFVTLSFVLAHYAVENNVVARIILQSAQPLESVVGHEAMLWLALLGLAGVKLGLIAYLDWAAPRLGRYRSAVLSVAIASGLLGAASNLVTAVPQFIPA
jgi:hypothetical protein